MAERVQHTIVRIEELLATRVLEMGAIDALSSEARKLLGECDACLKS
jgi:hypothetical protein